jgi:Peptidase propeptide and YPEB domain
LRARGINPKTGLVAAAVALLLLVGAGVAYATGSGQGSSRQASGANIEKAKSVALDHVNGRVTGSEVGDEEGYYEVEVTKDDGSQVDVHLDKNFNVTGTPADHEGAEHADAPDVGADNSGGE